VRIARDGAVKARSGALNALTGLIVTAPEALRQQLLIRTTTRGKATLCARFRPDQARLHEPVHAAKATLRSLARRVTDRGAGATVSWTRCGAGSGRSRTQPVAATGRTTAEAVSGGGGRRAT
jgi:hypothetical protein